MKILIFHRQYNINIHYRIILHSYISLSYTEVTIKSTKFNIIYVYRPGVIYDMDGTVNISDLFQNITAFLCQN